MTEHDPQAPAGPPPAGPIKTVAGGALMGIANIIPGVSGGTILLAMGLYEHFVGHVADVSRLRIRRPAILFFALLCVGLLVGIAGSVGPITWGLKNHHHVMFALFIGLTLGGVPLLWKEVDPRRAQTWVGFAIGLGLMLAFAWMATAKGMVLPTDRWYVWLLAGFFASVAMVLPGISGSLLLLVVGLYGPLTDAIKQWLSALKGGDWSTVWHLGISLHTPTAIGVLLGIAGLTNLLKSLLKNAPNGTVGGLMGLLIGSVVPLYPFGPLRGEDFAADAHPATIANIVLVVVAFALGFAGTILLSRLDAKHPGKAA